MSNVSVDATESAHNENQPENNTRRRFLTVATSVVGGVGVVGAAVPFLTSISPSAKAEAAGAPSKADISKLRKGEMMVIEWRGKPIYVVRHTDKSLELLNQNIERLSDPDSQQDQQPDYAKNENSSQ